MTTSSICLNMIVKDESHIIEKTLNNIISQIPITYWIISDTGSSDNTREIITDFFKEKNIPGELLNDEWKDFSHNRTIALNYAFNKTDYLFFFDADDYIHGNIELPAKLTEDIYLLQFGGNIEYTRPLLVSNRIKWKYVGVLHELLVNIGPINKTIGINGKYWIQSGRTGSRNLNPNKYRDDGLTLEKAFENEKDDTNLRDRYAYYAGQSFKDAGMYEKATEWFEKSLYLNIGLQYKYITCIYLGDCYSKLDNVEKSMIFWAKSHEFDKKRLEGIVRIMQYYYNKGIHFMVVSLYEKFKNIGTVDITTALFHNNMVYSEFNYYNQISGYYADGHKSAYDSCKYLCLNDTLVKWRENAIDNMAFYKEHFDNDELNTEFIKFFIDYLHKSTNNEKRAKVWKYSKDLIQKHHPEIYNSIEQSFVNNIKKDKQYNRSNKILIYTGFMDQLWNNTIVKTKSIGGAERAVAYLTRYLPKDYEIFISGDVADEVVDNITYIHRNKLQQLLDTVEFHTIIVSRYVSFFLMYPRFTCYKLFISAHDSTGFINGVSEKSVSSIIDNNNNLVDGVICLTNWHKSNILEKHPILSNKIHIINNGILPELFDTTLVKIKNKFVWTSCSYRGLILLAKLWPLLLEKIPDATLDISSYNAFPSHACDQEILEIINKHDSITHRGRLNTEQLYDLISNAEYWLYTNTFPETSCITGMEMLMSRVICLYYPLAGLVDTVGDYGIKVSPGTEIDTILSLTEETKDEMRQKGMEYAKTCSWKNRATEWSNVLMLTKKKWIFYISKSFEGKMIEEYINNQTNGEYKVELTNNRDYIIDINPDRLTFIYEIFDENIFTELKNTTFGYLNTEPLNLPNRINTVINILNKFPQLEYFDYSNSNLKILKENNIDIQNKIYLSYMSNKNDLDVLTNLLVKSAPKLYDFGIIKTLGGVVTERRQLVIDFLLKNNFTLNIIEGWGLDRDTELSKCRIILNIHGNLNTNVSNIFEHIRCDRLLESGFNILSETSYELDEEFINKYDNLKLIEYNDFFKIDNIVEIYNNWLPNKLHNNYVLNILKNTHIRLDIPRDHINFITKLIEIYNPKVIYDMGSSVLHWSQHAYKLWNNSDIYLFDAMSEMKLFYDDYSKINNVKLNYNIGVLCDEDFKRISFYQNNELSGGNSYYKEIGHPESHNIFNENNIKHKIGMTLETIVKNKNIPLPDLIKIDVQGAELDILKGSMSVINHAKFLIVELQHTEYNKGAPLCNITRDFLIENGWNVYAEKFCNNGPDADWCFINTKHVVGNDNSKIVEKIKREFHLNLHIVKQQLNIIDCFIFYNELDLLKYRLNILNDVVDYFVLVESRHTFVGKEKPLFYQDNKELFAEFNHKIIHIIVDDFPHKFPNIDFVKEEQWINEKFQRNCISRGIDKLHLHDNDVVILSDVDEIPRINLLKSIKSNEIKINEVHTLQMDFYYYNLHSKMDHYTDVVRILPYRIYKQLEMTIDDIRFKYHKKIINNAGWHLSYFGDGNFIKNKIENFAHQELNIELFTNKDNIENRIKNNKDLFDRPTNIIYIEIEDNNNLPPQYDNYLTKFYKPNINK